MADAYVTDVTFHGYVITTTVTSSGHAVKRWVDDILRAHGSVPAAGLDVEWRPSYGRGENPVATLQICVARACLIFQILHADYIPAELAEFLANRGIHFYGVGVKTDAERLSYDYGLQVAYAVDLRPLVAQNMNRPDLRQAGLSAIVEAAMGASLVKPHRVTMSRWDAECLSNEQIRYACIDAFVSYEVARLVIYGGY